MPSSIDGVERVQVSLLAFVGFFDPVRGGVRLVLNSIHSNNPTKVTLSLTTENGLDAWGAMKVKFSCIANRVNNVDNTTL